MGTLYENIIALCERKGIKGGKLCTDIGMSKGILTDLKMGRQTGISAINAQKIASYFGVTVGYLLGEEEMEKEKAPDAEAPEAEFQEVINLLQQLPEDKRQNALDYLKFLSSNNQ